jgi:hypothetical protein
MLSSVWSHDRLLFSPYLCVFPLKNFVDYLCSYREVSVCIRPRHGQQGSWTDSCDCFSSISLSEQGCQRSKNIAESFCSFPVSMLIPERTLSEQCSFRARPIQSAAKANVQCRWLAMALHQDPGDRPCRRGLTETIESTLLPHRTRATLACYSPRGEKTASLPDSVLVGIRSRRDIWRGTRTGRAGGEPAGAVAGREGRAQSRTGFSGNRDCFANK